MARRKKLKTVLEAQDFSDEQIGVFLCQKGMHETHLERWGQQMIEGPHLKPYAKKPQSQPGDLKLIRTLEQ